MKDFYKILRGEAGLGQEIPLEGGVFLYRAPSVSFYQKMSVDLGPQAAGAEIFLSVSTKHMTARQGHSCEFRRAVVAQRPLLRT